jgi:hypothetical protein
MKGGMTVFTLIVDLGPQLESYSMHDEKSFFPLQTLLCLRWWIMYGNQALCLVKNKTHRTYPCSYLGFGQRAVSLTETEQTLCRNRECTEVDSGPIKSWPWTKEGSRHWPPTHPPTQQNEMLGQPVWTCPCLLTHSLNHTPYLPSPS